METRAKKILVTGATGQQGGAVARQLLARGVQVLALVRDPSKGAAKEIERRGARLQRGDLNDPASITAALKGVDGVFSVQNPMDSDGIATEIRQGIGLADAALKAGVKHFIYSSVGAANQGTGIPFFDSKGQIERHIRASGLPCTIVRPVFFMENFYNYFRQPILGGTLPLPLDPGKTLQMIAVEDIGRCVAQAFTEPERWLNREVELAGDEMTMPQVAETLTRLLGRPVKYVQVPWIDFQKQVGEEMTKLYRWLNDMSFKVDIAALRREVPELAVLGQVLPGEHWQERRAA